MLRLAANCPSTTPNPIKSKAIKKVGVTGSCRQKYAQVMVLTGIRLLNNSTRLVGQCPSARFHKPNAITPPAMTQYAWTPSNFALIGKPCCASSHNASGISNNPARHIV